MRLFGCGVNVTLLMLLRNHSAHHQNQPAETRNGDKSHLLLLPYHFHYSFKLQLIAGNFNYSYAYVRMPLEDQLSIVSWLSRIPHASLPPYLSATPPSPQSLTLPAAGTVKLHGVKRKALYDPSSFTSGKKPRPTGPLTRQALRSITANMSKQNVGERSLSTRS